MHVLMRKCYRKHLRRMSPFSRVCFISKSTREECQCDNNAREGIVELCFVRHVIFHSSMAIKYPIALYFCSPCLCVRIALLQSKALAPQTHSHCSLYCVVAYPEALVAAMDALQIRDASPARKARGNKAK